MINDNALKWLSGWLNEGSNKTFVVGSTDDECNKNACIYIHAYVCMYTSMRV